MRVLLIVLAPLALLTLLSAMAGVLSYGLLLVLGDVLPLAKLMSKTTLLLLLLSIWPLKKALGLSWGDFGYAAPGLFFRQMGKGFLLALATLLPVLLLLYALDVQVYDQTRSWTIAKWLEKMGLGLFFSLLIGFAEETLFRGLLLSVFRRSMQPLAALGISSFYYALLHFLKSNTLISYPELGFNSSFQLLAEAFANCLNPEIITALTALFAVGLVLAMLRTELPNSLGWCIGCHAGWVWQIKTTKELFDLNMQADYLYLVSSYDGVIGPLVCGWLILVLLIVKPKLLRQRFFS